MKIISRFLVRTLNNMLVDYIDKCETYILMSIKSAETIKAGITRTQIRELTFRNLFINNEVVTQRFRILLMTSPKNALFEGTVDYTSENSIQLIGNITRNNKYGNHSSCINIKRLKPFCICK